MALSDNGQKPTFDTGPTDSRGVIPEQQNPTGSDDRKKKSSKTTKKSSK